MASLSQRIARNPLFLRFYENHIHGRFLTSFAREKMNHSTIFTDLTRLAGDLDDSDRPGLVVDLGCGTGWYARHLAGLDRYQNARIIGVDLSAEAIEIARRTASTIDHPAALEFLVGDAEHLGEQITEPIDEIWLCGCLHQMTDPGAALNQIGSGLAGAGRVYCQTFCRNPDIRADVDITVMKKSGHLVFDREQLSALADEAGLTIAADELKGMVMLMVLVAKNPQVR